jgi:hypothetical protein
MNKLFTLLALTATFFFNANHLSAQNCVVDTNNFEMITPISDSLPCIERGVPYQAVIHFFCAPQIAGIDIYSIQVTSFLNLPAGINYACTPANCTLSPWDHACMLIYGTTTDTVGEYQIDYNGFTNTAQGNASFDYLQSLGMLPEYYLKVIEPGDPCREAVNTGIGSVKSQTNFSVYPNPTKGSITIDFGNASVPGTVSVVDFTGRLVFEEKIAGKTKQVFNLANESKGIYLVRVRTADGVQVQKISVE